MAKLLFPKGLSLTGAVKADVSECLMLYLFLRSGGEADHFFFFLEYELLYQHKVTVA